MGWRSMQGGRIMGRDPSLVSSAIRLLATRSVWANIGLCIMLRRCLSVNSVVNLSRGRRRFRLICWYILTQGPILVSIVVKGSIRSPIWKNTRIYIQEKSPTNAQYAVKPSVNPQTSSPTPENTQASSPSPATSVVGPSNARWTSGDTRRLSTQNCVPWPHSARGPEVLPHFRPARPPPPRVTRMVGRCYLFCSSPRWARTWRRTLWGWTPKLLRLPCVPHTGVGQTEPKTPQEVESVILDIIFEIWCSVSNKCELGWKFLLLDWMEGSIVYLWFIFSVHSIFFILLYGLIRLNWKLIDTRS